MSRISILLFAFSLTACAVGPRHIAEYRAKERRFDPGEFDAAPDRAESSLYGEGEIGMFEDERGSRVGDIVVIRIDERGSATRSANTKLGRDSSSSYGVPAAFGLMEALKKKHPNMNPEQLFATVSKSAFDGGGTVERKGQLSATLPVTIRRVLPNGDLYVEGTSVVMVSAEEYHLYVSGVIRKVDIEADNTVSSSKIANAEIEYVGRGDVSDRQRPGWANRGAQRVYPF